MNVKTKIYFPLLLLAFVWNSCTAQTDTDLLENNVLEEVAQMPIKTGAESLQQQLTYVEGQKLALLVNPTSVVGEEHLVDVLLANGMDVVKIFAPEHGFRGTADAGEKIVDGMDPKSNLPVVSLYGKHKKPTAEDLAGIDKVIFDVQDVGARFYTYISTLHYLMEACAENKVTLLVLDRPNPNGDIVDGNILDMEYSSFVGMHPIPILHGMTIGEYAQMINGEFWLANKVQCKLEIIPCENYDHSMSYSLQVKPSPNLPNDRAIELYPSTCFFEGTVISEGRGTDWPFQVFGAPELDEEMTSFSFTPKSKEGAKYPKFENKLCYGFNISDPKNDFREQKGINLDYLISMYNLYPDKDQFFLKNGFFDLLAGGTQLKEDIIAGKSADEIKASWEKDLIAFKEIRSKYLLYKDFE